MAERSARLRSIPALLALLGVSMAGAGYVRGLGAQGLGLSAERGRSAGKIPIEALSPSPSALIPQQTLDRYCITCHNGRLKTAGLQLDSLDVHHVADNAQQWEKIVTKLRTGEMPPPGRPRPDAATYRSVATALEREDRKSTRLNCSHRH